MKIVAIIDTDWAGHHPSYFKLFTKTLLDLGHQVIAFCPDITELREWMSIHCPNQIDRLHTFKVSCEDTGIIPGKLTKFQKLLPKELQLFIGRWQYAKFVIQEAESTLGISPDLVFFAWLDSYLYWSYRFGNLARYFVDCFFPYKWSGVYFHPSYLRGGGDLRSFLYRVLDPNSVLRANNCSAVALLDEGIAEKLQKSAKGKPVIIFPDMTDESSPHQNYEIVELVYKKAKGRKIIGLLGHLSPYKGLLTLLEVAQKALDLEEDWFFLIAGSFPRHFYSSHDLKMIDCIVNSAPENCFFYFHPIPDGSKFNAFVDACSLLFAVYNSFSHSSNILTKGAVFEKPVIVSGAFCMGERVRQFNLGTCVMENNVEQCIEGLQYVFQHIQNSKPDFKGYRELHSSKRLYEAFTAILEAQS